MLSLRPASLHCYVGVVPIIWNYFDYKLNFPSWLCSNMGGVKPNIFHGIINTLDQWFLGNDFTQNMKLLWSTFWIQVPSTTNMGGAPHNWISLYATLHFIYFTNIFTIFLPLLVLFLGQSSLPLFVEFSSALLKFPLLYAGRLAWSSSSCRVCPSDRS